MSIKLTPIQESLKSFFGFNSFKGNQEEIIQSVLNGEDTFVIMPTVVLRFETTRGGNRGNTGDEWLLENEIGTCI